MEKFVVKNLKNTLLKILLYLLIHVENYSPKEREPKITNKAQAQMSLLLICFSRQSYSTMRRHKYDFWHTKRRFIRRWYLSDTKKDRFLVILVYVKKEIPCTYEKLRSYYRNRIVIED